MSVLRTPNILGVLDEPLQSILDNMMEPNTQRAGGSIAVMRRFECFGFVSGLRMPLRV